jgi:hypothetical protein
MRLKSGRLRRSQGEVTVVTAGGLGPLPLKPQRHRGLLPPVTQ